MREIIRLQVLKIRIVEKWQVISEKNTHILVNQFTSLLKRRIVQKKRVIGEKIAFFLFRKL